MAYAVRMKERSVIITLHIETQGPIELGDFVGAFTSLADEFRRNLKEKLPAVDDDSKIYVKEIRHGSYVADLIPAIICLSPLLSDVNNLLVIEDFINRWGSRVRALISGKLEDWNPSNSELSSWANATAAIARDPNASSRLEAATFEDGKREVRASITFDTSDAQNAQKTIDRVRSDRQTSESPIHERVLMVFTRTDTGKPAIGKKSADRVKIEELSEKSLALMYGSELASQPDRVKTQSGFPG